MAPLGGFGSPRAGGGPTSTASCPTPGRRDEVTYRAFLRKNLLGYTFKVDLDFGFFVSMDIEIRLRGIRGPVPRAGVGRELNQLMLDSGLVRPEEDDR